MKKAADMQIKTFWQKVGRRLMGLGYGSETIYSVIGILMKERKRGR